MLASLLGRIGHPFFVACGWLLAACYALVPNYVAAIALLTAMISVVVLPISIRSLRNAVKLQLLAPQINAIKDRYRARRASSSVDGRALLVRQQEELTALYKRHGLGAAGGALTALLQLPIFVVVYGTIRGFVNQTVGPTTHLPVTDPLYLPHHSAMFAAISSSGGQLKSMGLNLADSLRTPGIPWVVRIPILLLVVVAVALQYVQTHQANKHRLGSEHVPMTRLQQLLPLGSALLYSSIPSAVSLYYVVSAVFRFVQQELIWRLDPSIRSAKVSRQVTPNAID